MKRKPDPLAEDMLMDKNHELESGFVPLPSLIGGPGGQTCECGLVYNGLAHRSGAWHTENTPKGWVVVCPCCKLEASDPEC